jgi:hypothetical protein
MNSSLRQSLDATAGIIEKRLTINSRSLLALPDDLEKKTHASPVKTQ